MSIFIYIYEKRVYIYIYIPTFFVLTPAFQVQSGPTLFKLGSLFIKCIIPYNAYNAHKCRIYYRAVI